ncbi:MAG: hypothetical protein NPIRA02_38290 [Nitrospirales bacterium]|nr:MAG: hypothetical protein NPIRA02_38290 [Nitrospirales bacterium]
MLKYLLDTNIVIYTIKNKPLKVRKAFKTHDGHMAISSVTLMELYFGAEKSTNPSRNLRDIEGLSARLEILPYEEYAAAIPDKSGQNSPRQESPLDPMIS